MDSLTCTEQPVSQGKKNRTSPRNNPSCVASLLSSSSSEEEEEDEEDSRTFIPYTEMRHFPKRCLKYQASRTAGPETGTGSTSGGLSVDSGSVLDFTASGFSFFPVRQNEVDTSGSHGSEQASLPHSSSLGRISLTDVRFPGPEEHEQHDTDPEDCLEMPPLQTPLNRICASLPADEHCLHWKHQHVTTSHQEPLADLPVHVREKSQLSVDPSMEQLICFQTLQVAEDEGIASDCDSDHFIEGTPPASTVLSDAFGTSNMEGKYNQEFKLKGYQHTHYMGRS